MISPPVYSDAVHVSNGCYLSALVYLARFLDENPGEHGSPVAVTLPNEDGQLKPHTLAVMSWHGHWWARDEYYGVFALSCSSAAPWDPVQVQRRAESALPRLAAQQAGGRRGLRRALFSGPFPRSLRLLEVERAQRLLPCESEIHWHGSGADAVPLLFFRLGGEAFAVYDPATGTATAVSPTRESTRLLAAVAERLGYPAAPATGPSRLQASLTSSRTGHESLSAAPDGRREVSAYPLKSPQV